MPKKSAGLLPFRYAAGTLEVLLVHPGGPFWANKNDGAWSIPKGEFGDDEDPLAAARREFEEETGSAPDGEMIALAPVKQAGGKIVVAWAVHSDFDPETLRSHTFSMEWPPRSGRKQEFPEVDRASWFDVETAKQRIVKGQVPLIDQLIDKLSQGPAIP
jgi:predicted NUDIX family NTP pyrophosphohydrolase